jgi:hypothetical protein
VTGAGEVGDPAAWAAREREAADRARYGDNAVDELVEVEPAGEVDGGGRPVELAASAGGRSQAARLVRLALARFDLVTGDDGREYAVPRRGPNVALPFRGRGGLRLALARAYADANDDAPPSSSALTDALAVLASHAADAAPVPVFLRVAPHAGGVVVDLGTVDGRCVLVDGAGWRVAASSPVLFRRTALTAPLPDPVPSRDGLAALRELLNVSDDGFRLLVGWLVAALMPELPHPILTLLGEHGTAKSTAGRLLVSLVDPSPAPLRSMPRDLRQWAVSAAASRALVLDNCSGFPPWLSDALCKAVTGDGIVDRALYTDDDVHVLAFRRVIALTTIDAGALRGDLAERLLVVELDRIDVDDRRPEAEVLATFDAARSAALGALLSLVAGVLVRLPDLRLPPLPRMADFARVLAALDDATGWSTLATFTAGGDDVAEAVIGSDPFAEAVRLFVMGDPARGELPREWSGTTSELLTLITPRERVPRGWPRSAQAATRCGG